MPLLFVVLVGLSIFIYVRTHPLVFNESFFSHAHCIKQVGIAFRIYAEDNYGKFPAHTNGYGDALLLLLRNWSAHPDTLTGPGYDATVFLVALTNGTAVPESQCGRVYVQGLTEESNPDIAIFFDKLATAGGDHCHLQYKLFAPIGRELWTVGSDHRFIKESEWPQFATNQIELLIKEGFTRERAEAIYAETLARKK